ncbi:MAG TPA: hypothetical protein PKZ32_01185 [Candidatus Melainabacteria bacterium]|nr:hypothetical protein [Candidatus Melainabacteria bacterium]
MTYENFGNPGYTQPEQTTNGAFEDAYQRANWRATFGGDVGQNYQQGQQRQTQSGGQWRATYGGDVANNF